MPARRQSVRDYSFGSNIQQIYTIGECLGTGNYGTVRVCELCSNSPSEAHVIIGATSQEAMKKRNEEQMLLTAPIAGEKLACKTIFNTVLATKAGALAVHTEIQAMRIVDCHPNVVQLRGVHRDKMGMHLVMELLTGGDLYEELSVGVTPANRRLPECSGNWRWLHSIFTPRRSFIGTSSWRTVC